MAKAANLRMALAAAALLAAMETGSGSGTPTPFPPTSEVAWVKEAIKGAFKNGGKAAVAGNSLLLTTTKTGGSVAVGGAWWGSGPTLFCAPFGMEMGDTNAKAGLQVIFNANGPNDGAVEIDIFAQSTGTGLNVWAGQFGGAPPLMQAYPGADCIVLKAEREGDGDVALSSSSDGDIFTKVFTLAAGSVPAPVDGTIPTIVSVASHGGAAGTAIEVGPPTKTFSFGTGTMKDAIDAIENARSQEALARSDLRHGNAGAAHPKLVSALAGLDQANATIKGSPYAKTAPGKAAVKALTAARKLDGEADILGDSDPGVSRGKLNEAEKLKAQALAELRKL